jgi:hypothetical protein
MAHGFLRGSCAVILMGLSRQLPATHRHLGDLESPVWSKSRASLSNDALRVPIGLIYSAGGAFGAGAAPVACFGAGFVAGSDPQYWGSASIQDFST